MSRLSSAGLRLAALLAIALAAAGCAQLPHKSVVKDEPLAMPELPPPPANGTIYRASYGFQPLFEDRRPRMVGDILTIRLDEEVSAGKNSLSKADRDGEFGLSGLLTGDKTEKVTNIGAEAKGNNNFEGSGESEANNFIDGTITVSVRQVMPNGNLRVLGEKQIAINQGTEYIRFSGLVNPRTINDQNTVLSTQVAEARFEYVGEGYINEAQHMGWLQRFFLNVTPF